DQFCRDHPQFVRRLHDVLHYDKPEHLIQFMVDNQKLPSLYVELKSGKQEEWSRGKSQLRPLADRFPAVPKPIREEPIQDPYPTGEITADQTDRMKDDFSAYAVASAWYAYSIMAIPKPGEYPGQDEPIELKYRTKLRKPRYTSVIYRSCYPR